MNQTKDDLIFLVYISDNKSCIGKKCGNGMNSSIVFHLHQGFPELCPEKDFP